MIAALIIAAGKRTHADSTGPGKTAGSIPAIKRIVMTFQRAGIERVVVVCDKDGDNAEKPAAYMNVVFLRPGNGRGALDYIKAGLAYLEEKCEAAIITHTDVPLFSAETVQTLIRTEGQIRIPLFHGETGRPILIETKLFPEILSYSGEGGLFGAVDAIGIKPRYVEVGDKGVLANVDDEEGYAHLLAEYGLPDIRPAIRIRLVRDKAFYGPGAHQLINLIDESGSLREACRQMGISYGKGRAIIFTMEQQLGYPVIETQQGGKAGGHSAITEKGRGLMRDYSAFYTDAKKCLLELFDKHFHGYSRGDNRNSFERL